jgi:TPR repeat protein
MLRGRQRCFQIRDQGGVAVLAGAGAFCGIWNLNTCYEHGSGVATDEAACSCTGAADAGDVTAMVNLRNCYENGNGVAKDTDNAAELYRRAADAGDVDHS